VCADRKEIESHPNQELLVIDCLFFFPKLTSLGQLNSDTKFYKGTVKKGVRLFTEPHNIMESK